MQKTINWEHKKPTAVNKTGLGRTKRQPLKQRNQKKRTSRKPLRDNSELTETREPTQNRQ